MVNQGFWGAIDQFWTVEEKPRLHRRNTYFEDHPRVSSWTSLRLGIVAFCICITIVIFSLVGGIL